MDDPVAQLASGLIRAQGRFAVLAGSGLSRSAGISTAEEIARDLIRQLARSQGIIQLSDPEHWYEQRYGDEPTYPALLEHLTNSVEERRRLLARYFEPVERKYQRQPNSVSPAHGALAELVLEGHIRLVLTTNLDRLLEHALDNVGAKSLSICTPEEAGQEHDFENHMCTVIKLHGDYCGEYMKNTPRELRDYDERFCALLERTLKNYDWLICGWSAEHDVALREMLEKHAAGRRIFWTATEALSPAAAELAANLQAMLITIDDAGSLFSRLSTELANPRERRRASLRPDAPVLGLES